MMLLKLLLCIFIVTKAYNIGGRSAVAHPYPYMVSLQQKTNDTTFTYCSGVIASDLWVLSTAQCVDGVDQNDILVVAGVLKAYNFNHKYAQTRSVSEVIRHPKYKYKEGEVPKFDLVMLKMNKPFIFRSNVQNVTLGTTRSITGDGEIVGWGSTENQHQSNDLLFAGLDVTDHKSCETYYKNLRDKICVGNFEQTACFGDGGGPFVQYEEGQPIVVGLASATSKPCGSKPALYTNVAFYLKFIKRTTEEQ